MDCSWIYHFGRPCAIDVNALSDLIGATLYPSVPYYAEDQLGAIVFETNIEDQLYEINLSSWSGVGLYFVRVIDTSGETIDTKKIVLQ